MTADWKPGTSDAELRHAFDEAAHVAAAEWPVMTKDIGEIFDYIHLVGQGTYGSVFRVFEPGSNTPLALKMFTEPQPLLVAATPRELASYNALRATYLSSSESEVRNALYVRATAAHRRDDACPQHIVCYVAHFQAPFAAAHTVDTLSPAPLPYTSMPPALHRFLLTHFVAGVPIDALMRQPATQSGLTRRAYYRLLATAALALERMHKALVYHRDLSSANVHVLSWTNDDLAESVLIDLGASCISYDADVDTRCDINDVPHVNAAWRPPEVDRPELRHPGDVNRAMAARDIYSLGALFMQLNATFAVSQMPILRLLSRATSLDWRRRPTAFEIAHFAVAYLHPGDVPLSR